jgi:hypothetical protein
MLLEEVTNERVGEALTYLAEAAKELPLLRADAARAKTLYKNTRRVVWLTFTGTTTERDAQADTYPDVVKAENEMIEAEFKVSAMAAREAFESKVLDLWRTMEASRRRA